MSFISFPWNNVDWNHDIPCFGFTCKPLLFVLFLDLTQRFQIKPQRSIDRFDLLRFHWHVHCLSRNLLVVMQSPVPFFVNRSVAHCTPWRHREWSGWSQVLHLGPNPKSRQLHLPLRPLLIFLHDVVFGQLRLHPLSFGNHGITEFTPITSPHRNFWSITPWRPIFWHLRHHSQIFFAITPSRPIFSTITPSCLIFSWSCHRVIFPPSRIHALFFIITPSRSKK